MSATSPDGEVIELVGVYNADGTVLGELAYVVGKLTGRAHCALCDISHGRVRRRPEFDAAVARLPLPIRMLHRDELSSELAAAAGPDLPCVLAVTAQSTRVLLGPDALERCDGDPTKLVDAIEAALRT